MANLQSISRHNERQNEKYGNKDIDKTKTELNYHLKAPLEKSYEKEFERLREKNNLKGNLRLTGKKQSNVACEFMITSDSEFFKSLGADQTQRYFKTAYDFVCNKCGEQNIISAVVHMDEITPHMHLTYIPVVKGLKKGKEVLKINSSEFWKGFNSYGKLQDDFYNYVKEKGFDLERGETKENTEHLSVEEYKVETKKKEIEKSKLEVEQLEHAVKTHQNDLERTRLTLYNLEHLEVKKSLLGSKMTISEGDFNKLMDMAKDDVINSTELKKLKRDIEALRLDNGILKNSYDKSSRLSSKLWEQNNDLKGNLKKLKDQGKAMYEVLKKHDLIPEAQQELKNIRQAEKQSKSMNRKPNSMDWER